MVGVKVDYVLANLEWALMACCGALQSFWRGYRVRKRLKKGKKGKGKKGKKGAGKKGSPKTKKGKKK